MGVKRLNSLPLNITAELPGCLILSEPTWPHVFHLSTRRSELMHNHRCVTGSQFSRNQATNQIFYLGRKRRSYTRFFLTCILRKHERTHSSLRLLKLKCHTDTYEAFMYLPLCSFPPFLKNLTWNCVKGHSELNSVTFTEVSLQENSSP